MKEYFLLMQILEKSILKLLERCSFTHSDRRKSILCSRRHLRRLLFASLAIITYIFGLKGGGGFHPFTPPLVRHYWNFPYWFKRFWFLEPKNMFFSIRSKFQERWFKTYKMSIFFFEINGSSFIFITWEV